MTDDTKKREHGTLRSKVVDIESTFVELFSDPEHNKAWKSATTKKIMQIFLIPDTGLVREIQHHPGIYARFAAEAQFVQMELDDFKAMEKKLTMDIDLLSSQLVVITRNYYENNGKKIIVKTAEDIELLLKGKAFTGSAYYSQLSAYIESAGMEEDITFVSTTIESIDAAVDQLEIITDKVTKLNRNGKILDMIVSGLAYQKKPALTSLADLMIQGINQE